MIISKTPLRISFVGGGTDISNYYKSKGGCVISTAIDKYIYITINKRFDDTIRASYSKTETVDDVNKINHDIVKALEDPNPVPRDGTSAIEVISTPLVMPVSFIVSLIIS